MHADNLTLCFFITSHLLAVADTNETIGAVVADQDGSVRQLQHAGRASGGCRGGATSSGGAGTGQETLHQRFIAGHATSVSKGRHGRVLHFAPALPLARPLLTRSSIHFRIRSAICWLFLSCMIMWLLPLTPVSAGL